MPADSIEAYREAPGRKKYKDFVVIENSMSIDEAELGTTLDFSINDGSLTFTAADRPIPVRIFNAAGSTVRDFTLAPHSTQSVSIHSLARGVYIAEFEGKIIREFFRELFF